MRLTFTFFLKKKLKRKATSNRIILQVLSSIGLDKIGICLGDGPFSCDIGRLNLHPSKGTHWVCYINEINFDNYGCSPPQKLSSIIIKQYGHCLYSEYKIQSVTSKRDSYCSSYCLYLLYLTEVLGFDFKSAVLNFYYQRFS